MICSTCEEVSQVPTGTRIPTAFINTLWDRRLESGRQRELDLSPQGSEAASQADGCRPPQSIVVSCEQVPGTLQPSEFVENSSKPLTIPVSHLRGKERPPLVPLSAVRGRAKQTGTWQTMRRDEVADDRKSNADDRRRRDQRRKVAGAPERRS